MLPILNRGCKPLPQAFAETYLSLPYFKISKKYHPIRRAGPFGKELRPLVVERLGSPETVEGQPRLKYLTNII
jgi:hypothetical protein